MPFQIEGGKTGRIADVTLHNHLRTLATAVSPQWEATLLARAWTTTATQTASGAADNIYYMRNTGTRDLVVTRISLLGGSAETISVNLVTGTPASGTTLAPINRYATSSRQPRATIESGNDITGLTSSGTIETLAAPTTVATYEFFDRPLVLAPGGALALNAVAGSIAVTFHVDFYEQVVDPVDLT